MMYKGKTMKRTQIQLTETQYSELKNLSAARSTSLAHLIRQAVDSFLDKVIEIDRDDQKQRAIAAAGQFHSGLGDLASDHDRYLGEAYSDDNDLR
jgi:predicted DNA-binding protein